MVPAFTDVGQLDLAAGPSEQCLWAHDQVIPEVLVIYSVRYRA